MKFKDTNYKQNEIDWKIGDLVIHDAEAKTTRMLMMVTGYDFSNCLYKTEYVNKKPMLKYYFNRRAVLHDPKIFGIEKIIYDNKLEEQNE